MFGLFLTMMIGAKYSERLLGAVPGDSVEHAARQLNLKLEDDPAVKNDYKVAWPEWLRPLRSGYKDAQFSLYLSHIHTLTTEADIVEAMRRNFRQ